MKRIALALAVSFACTNTGPSSVFAKGQSSASQAEAVSISSRSGLYLDAFSGPSAVLTADLSAQADSNTTPTNAPAKEKIFTLESVSTDLADATMLDISGQGYTMVDLTGFTKLKYLDVSGNKLKSLDLTPCPRLQCVDCSGNSISSIRFGSFPLKGLNCSDNALSSLDLAGQSMLPLFIDPVPWGKSSPSKTTETKTSPQSIILPSNTSVYVPAEVSPGWDGARMSNLNVTGKTQYNAATQRFEKIEKGDVITYTYATAPAVNEDRFLMSVRISFTGEEDPALEPVEPTEKPLDPFGSGGDDLNGEKPDTGSDAMQRLYNPNSGEHFYTKDLYEKSVLVSLGWTDEGTGWIAPELSKTPVYRLYNANAGDHHYTLNLQERDELRRLGWKYEGIGWYSDDRKGIPLYRQYNPNAIAGAHNYTTDRHENDVLISLGWKKEGISWYGLDPDGK